MTERSNGPDINAKALIGIGIRIFLIPVLVLVAMALTGPVRLLCFTAIFGLILWTGYSAAKLIPPSDEPF